MRKTITKFLSGIALLVASQAAQAQCSFTATITPNNLVMCPGAQDTLWTQAYDHYQWFKNGTPISSDTMQYHVVDNNDWGSSFSVVVTLNNCTDTSAQVSVDGHIFNTPSITKGGNYREDPQSGDLILCSGDTAILVLDPPYSSNIQWYNGGSPIAMANNDSLYVYEFGSYSVSATPGVCPNYQQSATAVNVDVHIAFNPFITNENGTLYVGPDSTAYTHIQWVLDGMELAGANNASFTPSASGTYSAICDDGTCSMTTAPFEFDITGIDENIKKGMLVNILPNPAKDFIQIQSPFTVNVMLYSLDGKLLMQQKDAKKLNISRLADGLYMLSVQDKEGQILKRIKVVKQ